MLTVLWSSAAAVAYGTWESLVLSFGNSQELRRLRKEIILASQRPLPPRIAGPKLVLKTDMSWDYGLGAYVLLFPGEPVQPDT